MLMPGCLDTTPETLSGIEILAPLEVIEGDMAEIKAHGTKPSGAKYLWDFGDDTGSSGEIVKHTYLEEGEYTITLTVVDGEGKIGTSKTSIKSLHRNEQPVASLDATYGGQGQTIKINSIAFFDGGASSDPDGDVLSFEWDFGDGSYGDVMRPNHEYTLVGNYTVTLTVRDNGNMTSTSETWVLVQVRTYVVGFVEQTIVVPAHAGYTAEGASTLQMHNYPYNITAVNYDFEWSEDEVSDSPDNPVVGTMFPDDFSLAVATNFLVNLTENSTSGNIELNFVVLNSIPNDLILSLGSVAEVNQYLFTNGYTSAKGQGEWDTVITCNEASSITDLGLNTFLDTDDGNDWVLFVEYTYYKSIITET